MIPFLHSVLASIQDETGHSHPTWEDFKATDWIWVVLAGVVAAWVIWKAVMYTLRPGETEPDHIKRIILTEPRAPGADEGHDA